MAAARQRVAQAGLVLAVALLAGCGSSASRPDGATLRLALPLIPKTVDPARAGDLPSLNVAHELYSGLTRFSGTGVVPDLAQSWDIEQGGLVWTFHLRKGLRWSDDRPITAQDVRRSWLRALAPATKAPLAGPDLGIVKGARGYHATGRGVVGVQALDDRTLRVTLQHPIPWLDQLAANPIAAAYRPDAYSGPFRLARRLVLERNLNYWNVRKVKPARLVLTTQTKGADAILPRGTAPPGLPWVQTAKPPTGPGWRKLPTLSVQLLWSTDKQLGLPATSPLVPKAMPGFETITATTGPSVSQEFVPRRPLTLAYTEQDALAPETIRSVTRDLHRIGATVVPHRYGTLRELAAVEKPGDIVLLGWSAKVFDAYNILDLFPCGSAFNVAHWCDPSYDALMRRAVRTLDDHARWELERKLLNKLPAAAPAAAISQPSEYVHLGSGLRGFSWSPIGFYELDGMTRS
jgi:ABC-type oligopeptide transport system substrate-binding subunit